jgi:hypothetical protein
MGLSAATHFADEAGGVDGHAGFRFILSHPRDKLDGRSTPMPEENASEHTKAQSQDEVSLEMMKFIAVTTGYGKGTGAAGFGGKATRSAEEYAESLLQLFMRCRDVVKKG